MKTLPKSHPTRPRLKRWLLPVAAAYLGLLVISHGVRMLRAGDYQLPADRHMVMVQAVKGEQQQDSSVRMVYEAYGPADAPVVVLLHGSPGDIQQLSRIAPHLASRYRLIIPDLPGFGDSTHRVPDYSFRAHAHYTLQMLDALEVQQVHLVGFSMGGGVALHMADIAPQRVASLVMLSSIGVQELELLGNYHINHMLHGLQLGALWLLHEGVPHMGLLDGFPLNVEYARNFYDSDQRPLRDILKHVHMPLLIVHSETDFLVPVEAAREHHRLVPQSELHLMEGGHFLLFQYADETAQVLSTFLQRVEQSTALRRSEADPARVAAAAQPFDASQLPMVEGFALFLLGCMLAAATLASEDLASVTAGVLVAQGRIAFPAAVAACFVGIFVGDVLLLLLGRSLGRPALRHAPLKWFVREEDVARSSAWFEQRGGIVILVSRFLPGVRLPTYVAAGMVCSRLWKPVGYLFIAALLWTPLIVGLAALLGSGVLTMISSMLQGAMLLRLALAAMMVLMLARLITALLTFRGRRMLVASLRRVLRWEFWPPWAFYPPVVLYCLWLALKHRSLTLFTAANPGIIGGGLVGESKMDILRPLLPLEAYVAQAVCIGATLDAEERVQQATLFMARHNLHYPVVLKPDVGERGYGVVVVQHEATLREYLHTTDVDTIVQAYAPGAEFGVFYYRFPGEERGRIFSITDKRFPVVVGDGQHTLEWLVLKDSRAVCMATAYARRQPHLMYTIPSAGEPVQLVDIGTHCRGALFLDGSSLATPALEAVIDHIGKQVEGFYFGRFDIRTPSIEDFKQGRNFKVVELNGVSSESTNIYDPAHSLLDAYRILFAQWRIAFAIGAANRARGVRPLSLIAIARLLLQYVRQDSSRSMVRPQHRPAG